MSITKNTYHSDGIHVLFTKQNMLIQSRGKSYLRNCYKYILSPETSLTQLFEILPCTTQMQICLSIIWPWFSMVQLLFKNFRYESLCLTLRIGWSAQNQSKVLFLFSVFREKLMTQDYFQLSLSLLWMLLLPLHEAGRHCLRETISPSLPQW